MRALSRLVLVEARLFLREPSAYFWTLLFPVALVVIIGAVPASREFTPEFGQRGIDHYTPVVLTMAFAMVGLFITPTYLAEYREKGVLRRLATTPVGPARVLVAQLAVHFAVTVVTTVLVLGTAALLWDVPLPAAAGGFLLAFALSVGAMLALGLLLAAVLPSGKTAAGVGSALFFPLMFFAGLYVPVELLPPAMGVAGGFTPTGAAVAAFAGAAETGWPGLGPSAVLGGYAVVLGVAAARLFRW